MTLKITRERVAFWNAVNEYVLACGGNTTMATAGVRRERAVTALERALKRLMPCDSCGGTPPRCCADGRALCSDQGGGL